MKQVNCILCNSKASKLLFRKNNLNIVKCPKCSLVYVNPRLSGSQLKELYNTNKISPMQYYLQNELEDAINFEKRLKVIGQYAKKGSLLDIGCNIGTFMQVAESQGWKTIGIDINRSAVIYAKKKGLNVFSSAIEHAKLKKSYFDVIMMNDVVEHLENPVEVLEKIKAWLKKDGILFIATPNIGSMIAKISGKNWLHVKPDEHIYYFSKKTISMLLGKAGFSTAKIMPLGRIRTADVILEKAKTYTSLPYSTIKQLGLMPLMRKVKLNINLHDEMGIIAKKK